MTVLAESPAALPAAVTALLPDPAGREAVRDP